MGSIMDENVLFETELSRRDWSQIRDANGSADRIPHAIRDLVSARSPEEVDQAYWRLENHVVVQGFVFEAAPYTVSALVAALVKPDRPKFVRTGLLELLFQIVHGETHPEEKARGMGDLAEMCRDRAREGLWLLYRECLSDRDAGAIEVIQLVDSEADRLGSFDRISH